MYLENDSEESITLRIAVLGRTLVGKSAITYQFIHQKFPEENDTTTEDEYSITLVVDDIKCKLIIIDTAGQDDYQSMLDTWIAAADGFILVYSIDNQDSFDSTKYRYERIVKNKQNQKYSVIIIGNKCDLEDQRVINREVAEKYCQDIGIDFMETSALKKINVKETFLTITKELLKIKCPERFGEDNPVQKKRCFCF